MMTYQPRQGQPWEQLCQLIPWYWDNGPYDVGTLYLECRERDDEMFMENLR